MAKYSSDSAGCSQCAKKWASGGTPPQATRSDLSHLESSMRQALELAPALLTMPSHVRPRYFDGRFLAARDLQSDQEFFFERQAGLATVLGTGVLAGLHVSQSGTSAVQITPGVAVTKSGELLVLPDTSSTTPALESLTVSLDDLPTIERLSVEVGFLDKPSSLERRPTGLFVLALRALRYTANPQGAYPSSLEEQRTVENGDVIEGIAVTLIPYPGARCDLSPSAERALVARAVFLGNSLNGNVAEVVPLALLQLDAGRIQWLDEYLVRRELGSEPESVAASEPGTELLRQAFALQYQRHLADVLAARQRDGRSLRFAAGEEFRALPAVGPLPAAAVDLARGTELWFPASVEASVAEAPPDEIAELVRESATLPPLDLTASPEALPPTSVLILVPRPRFPATGEVITPIPAPVRRSGAPIGSLAEILRGGFPQAERGGALPSPGASTPAEEHALLWYVRCRTEYLLPDAIVVAEAGV